MMDLFDYLLPNYVNLLWWNNFTSFTMLVAVVWLIQMNRLAVDQPYSRTISSLYALYALTTIFIMLARNIPGMTIHVPLLIVVTKVSLTLMFIAVGFRLLKMYK